MSNLSRAGRSRTNPNAHNFIPNHLTLSRELGFWEIFTTVFAIPILTLIAYTSSLRGEFVFDDTAAAIQNATVTHARTLLDIIRILPTPRGILTATYALNHIFSSADPFGWHFTNLILHATNAVLVFFIIRKLSVFRSFPAIVGSLLFTVHPMLTSAVSSISGRSSVLSATFYFATILAFLYNRWVMVLALGVLAYYSKQDTITLPILFIAMILCRPPRTVFGRYSALIPLGGMLLCGGLVMAQLGEIYTNAGLNKALVSSGFGSVLSQPQYLYTYLHNLGTYLIPRMIVPVYLSSDPTLTLYTTAGVLACLLFLIYAAMTAFIKRSNALFSTGLCIFLFSPLLVYAFIPIADPILEHRAYIPMLGVILILTSGLDWMNQKWKLRPLADLILMLLMGTFITLTIVRDQTYITQQSFYEAAVQSSPSKFRPHLNLGESYQHHHQFQQAIEQYNLAITISPNSYTAYSNLAALQIDSDDFTHAESNLIHALKIQPKSVEPYINLGILYFRRGRNDIAMEMLDRALSLDPNNIFARDNRNIVLQKTIRDNDPRNLLPRGVAVTVVDGRSVVQNNPK